GDGIRVLIVTGVQTCALPIWSSARPSAPETPIPPPRRTPRSRIEHVAAVDDGATRHQRADRLRIESRELGPLGDQYHHVGVADEIGRASCRESVTSNRQQAT